MTAKPGFYARWKNTIFSAGDHFWMLVLWAVSTPIFIRALGTETFGIWILINAVIGLGGVMSFGFGEATVRYVAKYRGENSPSDILRVLRTTLSLYALVGIASGLGIALAADAITSGLFKVEGSLAEAAKGALYLAGIALFVTSYLKTFEGVINGFERYDLTARVNMITRSGIILGNIALALSGFGLIALIACAVVGLTAQATTLMVLARRRFVPEARLMTRPDWRTTKEIASFGAQSWVQITTGALSTLADRFLVSYFLGPAAAGVYAICLQLAQQIHLLLMRGLAFLVPATSRDVDDAARLGAYRAGIVVVMLLLGTVALPLYLLASPLMTLWVGAEFAAKGSDTLRIMTATFSLLGMTVPAFLMLNGAGRPGWNTIIGLLYAVLGIALAAQWLPVTGIEGAAWGRLVAVGLVALLPVAVHCVVLPAGSWRSTVFMGVWLALLGAGAAALDHGLGLRDAPMGLVAFLGWAGLLGLIGGVWALIPVAWWRTRDRARPGAQ